MRLTVTRRTNGAFFCHLLDTKNLGHDLYSLDFSPPDRSEFPSEAMQEAYRAAKLSVFFSAINSAYLLKEGIDLAHLQTVDDHGIRDPQYFDAATILSRFPQLVTIFEEEITHPTFASIFLSNGCFQIASGTVFLDGLWNSPSVTFLGIKREPLAALSKVLQSAELIHTSVLERVFSPEEELLSPYFDFLTLGYDTTIRDERLRPQLELALDYFGKEDYTHTISALGLIAEDYLTQIYEFYLRIPCPKGSTLGQIYDQLHQKIREQLTPKQMELPQMENIYKVLSDLQKSLPDTEEKMMAKLVPPIREILNLIKADRRYFLEKIDSTTKVNKRVSLFPEWLQDNLMELIRNRNAASHKTRIPLGRFEALRTIYCLTAFSLWWREEKERTDWGLEPIEILKMTVEK